ncbi:MAG: L-dopachrome tautomerase-related protein [Myxococcaceae bacterium]|nr:L-dopachrome tautomerase-related protein [Myxococcaceae bacterium]
MKRMLRRTAAGLGVLLLLAVVAFRLRYGGSGADFPKLAEARPQQQAEVVATLDAPPGNLAVSATGRIFFTTHAESRPTVKVHELVDGKPVPYPSLEMQQFDAARPSYGAVFSLRIDARQRLWSIDHGEHGVFGARLVAVDLATNTVVKHHVLPADVAGLGSYVQDLQVDREGRFLYLADIGVLNGRPGLIIVDAESGRARRVLDGHPALQAEPWTINAQGRRMVLLGGLFWMHPAFDPIALDRRGEWLYVGAMSSRTLWRVRVADLLDEQLSADTLGSRVERYADKPQCDGLTIDDDDTLYLTGIEDGVVWALKKDKSLVALAGHPKMRWPDGLAFGPDGFVYVADSDIPDVMLKSASHIASAAPFHLFRFKALGPAAAGQ